VSGCCRTSVRFTARINPSPARRPDRAVDDRLTEPRRNAIKPGKHCSAACDRKFRVSRENPARSDRFRSACHAEGRGLESHQPLGRTCKSALSRAGCRLRGTQKVLSSSGRRTVQNAMRRGQFRRFALWATRSGQVPRPARSRPLPRRRGSAAND
jgi:hypothetical protein